jgi:hypothetical protein
MAKKEIEQSGEAGTTAPKHANSNRPDDDAASVLSPLEYMLRLLRDEAATKEDRKWAAYHAAPFCHSKLCAVEPAGDLTLRHEDALDALD